MAGAFPRFSCFQRTSGAARSGESCSSSGRRRGEGASQAQNPPDQISGPSDNQIPWAGQSGSDRMMGAGHLRILHHVHVVLVATAKPLVKILRTRSRALLLPRTRTQRAEIRQRAKAGGSVHG